MKFADRISGLGTETAFAVSAEANALAEQGRRVYPFHLGDLNVPTPENIVQAALKAIRDGKTGYCPNAGIPALRDALAADVGAARGVPYALENVSVQPGGKPVIGKFLMALMNPGDGVLYPNPGFPIYESLIEFHKGVTQPYAYISDDSGFVLDMEHLEKQITPQSRLLILNDLHNPTSAECSAEDFDRLAELVLKHDLYVLSDEAYFDIRYDGESRSLVSWPGLSERCVILYTFGKKYAMTGWRLGAAVGPKEAIEIITRININDESCTNHFAQYAALEALTGDQGEAEKTLVIFKERRDTAVELLNNMAGIRCHRPNATFYLYPDVTGAMELKGLTDDEAFRRAVLRETGVSFCNRLHFGRPMPGETRSHIRLAYSGIDTRDIREGLAAMKQFLES